ncbi:MAG: outer membrane lipoprotein chaperone LolA [Gammaproteobacteria bacterium]|nr:outer membrane lipoprotein chaperone LolA [Gammaproteobacteria bacterium]
MRLSINFVVALVSCLLVSIVSANSSGPARAELERFATELQQFQAEFTQTVKSQDGRIQDQTQGDVWLQSPDRLRWVYTGDFPETIVADGLNVWIHDELLEQVTVKPQSADAADSPLMILADVSQLDDQFKVTELGDYNDMLLLELKSLDVETEFERILLGLDSSGIRMMAMEDAFGQRTEIYFENVLRNTSIDMELFKFTPPEGSDVVGVAALPE